MNIFSNFDQSSIAYRNSQGDASRQPGMRYSTEDKSWYLSHGQVIVTFWHHDADGKITVVNIRSGVKIWITIRLNLDLSPSRLAELARQLTEEKLVQPEAELGKMTATLLVPGDDL